MNETTLSDIRIATASDDGKRYWCEPHYNRLDRTQYPRNVDPFSSIWCICKTCRDYYKDVREAS